MILGKYIRELLKEKKRVILAGFGNLEMKAPDEAQSPSGSRIDPPGISVRFDSSFSKDDGLLATSYASGEGLEEDEAQQRVLELIDAIKFALDRGESYTLPETGIFSRDEDGKVRFRVDPAWLLEPDQYGLESMDLLELEEEQPEEKEAEKEKDTTTPTPTPEPASKLTPLAPAKPKAKPKKWSVIWIIAFLLIIVLAVLILVPTKENEDGKRSLNLRNRKPDKEVVDPQVNTPPEEEITTSEQEEGEQEEGETLETPVSTDETEEVVREDGVNNYFIIAGSFSKLRNASDLQDQLKLKGFEAEVLITENRMYRVSVSSYATKAEAEKALMEIKKKQGLESCWLLSN